MRITTIVAVTAALAAVTVAEHLVAAETSAAELAEQIEKISESLGGEYVRIGKIHTSGISEGQTKKFMHMLRTGACYRFVATGGSNMKDLDLKVFSGGSQLAVDVGKVTDPVAHHCAQTDTKVEVRVQAFKGRGQFAYGLYVKGDAGEGELSDAAAAVLDELNDYAAQVSAGMEPVCEAHVNGLGYRNAESIEVLLDRPRCYKFVVLGGAGVTDLSLSLLIDGEEVAGDRISGRKPLIQWCAPGRMRVEVKIGMYGGSGYYALGIYGAKASAVEAPEQVGGEETDFIANRIRQLHAQYGKGRAAVTPVHRGNLSTNNEQVFNVRLSAGHCYTIIAAGSPSVKDLEITLLDSSGNALQHDKSKNSFPVLDTEPCPAFTGRYTVKLKMIRGFGQFGAQVFSD